MARRGSSAWRRPFALAMGRVAQNVGIIDVTAHVGIEGPAASRISVGSHYEQRQGRGRIPLLARVVTTVPEPVGVSLYGPDYERRRRDRPAPEPPLDHHGRNRTRRRGSRPGGRRRAADSVPG